MPSLIRAIAKALAKLAGPVGAPVEFALSLYDDERSEKRNAELTSKIVEGHALTREAIAEIFELKEGYSTVRAQLVSGFHTALQLLMEDHEIVKSLKANQGDVQDSIITPLLRQNLQRFASGSFLTEQKVIDELTHLYSMDIDYFLAIVYPAGFPQGMLTHHAPPKATFLGFVHALRGCLNESKASIYNALSNDKPASEILRVAASLYRELSTE
jgi:hypothetical protein